MGRPQVDPDLIAIRAAVRAALAGEPGACTDVDRPSEFDFASYVEGRLSGAKEDAFESHLAFCPSCSQDLVAISRAMNEAKEASHAGRWKIAAGVGLFLGAGLAALLAGRAVGDAIDSTVVAGVQRALGGKASVGRARLALAGGPGVAVEDLEVRVAAAEDPLLVAPHARFTVEVGALATGAIQGAVTIDRPVINLVRGADGRVNVDALLPHAQGGQKSFFLGERKLKSMKITDGRVRLVDQSGGGVHEVRLDSVDANLGLSPGNRASVAARAGVESEVQNLALKGEVGPWGTGVEPRYRFDQVALDDVPLRAWPDINRVLNGALSFDGNLSTYGDTWSEMSEHVAGAGRMGVAAGTVAGRNLVADVVRPLLSSATERPAMLDGSNTAFDEMSSAVTIANSRISAQRVSVIASGYSVEGKGSLSATGEISFHGQLSITAAASQQLVDLAPAARGLLNARGEVAIPFSLAGAWPNVRATVDVNVAAQRALSGGFALLRLLSPLGLLG